VKKGIIPELLWIGCVVVAAGLGWLLVRRGATPNGRVAVEKVLREMKLADVESVTVYPLMAGPGPAPGQPAAAAGARAAAAAPRGSQY
jgi:hypothetical protein